MTKSRLSNMVNKIQISQNDLIKSMEYLILNIKKFDSNEIKTYRDIVVERYKRYTYNMELCHNEIIEQEVFIYKNNTSKAIHDIKCNLGERKNHVKFFNESDTDTLPIIRINFIDKYDQIDDITELIIKKFKKRGFEVINAVPFDTQITLSFKFKEGK